MFLLYFAAYMSILTYAPVPDIDSDITIAHFTIAAISPMGNFARAMYVALNLFSLTCDGSILSSNPSAITLYGGPILYLILQFVVLFAFLVWYESGTHRWTRLRKIKGPDLEEKQNLEKEIIDEVERASNSQDGLRVLHLSKAFGKFIAVGDVTFGVPRGEVFALLGPNGAGKTTTISLIRGDIQPSRTSTDDTNILVENISVLTHRAAARQNLGVCPQFDALDHMTVEEHLRFYASIHGVSDPKHNVDEILRVVGLAAYADKTASTLSGGTKRKLSLGIALIGNPSVLLLDEPSSGMDAASKRIMWRTLASLVPGRSIVLTTHSMEEADALAHRAGIMKNRMAALGATEYLRRKYGNRWHVHLVHKHAPHTSPEDMNRIRDWAQNTFLAAEIEKKTYHGQIRFSVPAGRLLMQQTETLQMMAADTPLGDDVIECRDDHTKSPAVLSNPDVVVGMIFQLLEKSKEELGIQYYTINQTSLDEVFLTIVGRDHVETT
jgi:ATP-binding cassette, subfamily A (ABC1), member 3